eukprot:SAG31_NODE_1003_length_10447_cov_3.491593_6_plen_86_part_00
MAEQCGLAAVSAAPLVNGLTCGGLTCAIGRTGMAEPATAKAATVTSEDVEAYHRHRRRLKAQKHTDTTPEAAAQQVRYAYSVRNA